MDTLMAATDAQRDELIELQRRMVAIPALGPENGGEGEKEKAEFLEGYMKGIGLGEVRWYNAPDDRVPCGFRPNLVSVIPGRDTSKTLWVISHMDIVPAGDESLWETSPFEMVVDGDLLIGRGVEDNQQGIASSLIAARAILDQGVTPAINYGIILVADEETGSAYGLGWLVENHPELFGSDDLYLVPDYGTSDSVMVEVAEKNSLHLLFSVYGKQCHASTPDQGVNSLVAASALILKLDTLNSEFNDSDPLFRPDRSTFACTQKLANVPNSNTIPGLDVFHLDARVLPHYDLDAIMDSIRERCDQIEKEYGVQVKVEVVRRDPPAPATSPDSDIARRVIAGVKAVYGVDARPTGIGGGTVAAFLRRKGLDAVVWSTAVPNPHVPNERTSISANLGDAKVISHMLLNA